MGILENIRNSLGGSTATGKKKTPTEAEQLELEGTEKLVSEAKAEFVEAVQKPFDLIPQLLIGEARTQWDKIVKEMFDRDTWVGVNGKMRDGPRLRTWKSLTDCIEPTSSRSCRRRPLKSSDSTCSKWCASHSASRSGSTCHGWAYSATTSPICPRSSTARRR